MTRWKHRLTGPLARNAAIALYVICVAGLIMAYMSVSLRKVDYAAYARAQPAAAPGAPVAMRGVVLDARLGVPLRRGEVQFDLVDAAAKATAEDAPQGVAWARTSIQPNGFFHLSAPLPAGAEPGDYRLRMQTKIDPRATDAAPEFTTDAPFNVLPPPTNFDYWPAPTERREADKNEASGGVKSSDGPIQIALWPADGEVARGLKSTVFVRTTRREDGAPVSAKLHISQIDGISEAAVPATIQTDSLGLAIVPVSAGTDLVWELSTEAPGRLGAEDLAAPRAPSPVESTGEDGAGASSQVSRARLVLSTVPSQVSLRMSEPLAVPGRSADGALHSLFRDGGVMVDLYQADRWVDAKVFGLGEKGGGIRVDIPKSRATAKAGAAGEKAPLQLYRVQVYRSVYGVENAWDIDYLVGASGAQLDDYQQAARALAEYITAHVDDPYFDQILAGDAFESSTSKRELSGWIRAMTEVLPRHLDVPAPLINSREASIAKLDAETAEIQNKLRLLTIIALLIGMAVVGYLVLLGIGAYREQGRLLQDVDLEMDEDPADDEGGAMALSRNIQRENLIFGALIFIVVGTLSLFVLGLLMVLSYF
ncbi:hypothetical protein [Bradymonas sediminis]|uniref:Uncharacterized protein n=1 Tax=Bradymonas sediminis TaxID=1548548 RepID=A0A2Z4FR34_9DELT|nr:hypothetical protein [Bradymonas sediminis]AWV91086.1 hypothetical protein DN745_17810 [Bradymonas sediminis]TDP75172.1 hypothetical protein DFR33_10436 [Bradymonas sediminis]